MQPTSRRLLLMMTTNQMMSRECAISSSKCIAEPDHCFLVIDYLFYSDPFGALMEFVTLERNQKVQAQAAKDVGTTPCIVGIIHCVIKPGEFLMQTAD
jgi:hypothetical protein